MSSTKTRFENNHHATLARLFAERYLDDTAILDIIELHDEAFNAWRIGASKGRWNEAEAEHRDLLDDSAHLSLSMSSFFAPIIRQDQKSSTS